MKLHELFEESKPDYYNRLEQELNIQRLGNGAFARVFQHPTHPEVVVKVFTDEDKAYKAFLKFCLQNQGNKYLPKILSVHHHDHTPKKKIKDRSIDEIVDNKYTLVFMEKLTPATKDDVTKFIKSVPFEAQHLKNNLKAEVPYRLGQLVSFYNAEWTDLSRQTEDKDLAEVANFFVGILKKQMYSLDLHDKNVMMRGSQLVFTDPTS